MNMQSCPQRFSSRLTRKYQATIPQAIRNALGLKAGDLVNFTLDEDGNARIVPADNAEQIERRRQELAKGVMEARRLFRAENSLPDGMSNKEWFDLMRGPPAEI